MREKIQITAENKNDIEKIRDSLNKKGHHTTVCENINAIIKKLNEPKDLDKYTTHVVITTEMLKNTDCDSIIRLNDFLTYIDFTILDSNDINNSIIEQILVKRRLSSTFSEITGDAFRIQCVDTLWMLKTELLDIDNNKLTPEAISRIQRVIKEFTKLAISKGQPSITAFILKIMELIENIKNSKEAVISEEQKDCLFELLDNIRKSILSF